MRFWRRDEEPERIELTKKDLELAHERGVEEERKRHRSHPILGALVFVVAVIGAGMIYLAAHEGSFTRGGEVVDQKLASATGQTTSQVTPDSANR